jgi:hypothetical protein
MTQRQIAGPSGGDFFVVGAPGRAQRIGPGLRLFVMPVGHRHLGSRVAWFLETPRGCRPEYRTAPPQRARIRFAGRACVRPPPIGHNRRCAAKLGRQPVVDSLCNLRNYAMTWSPRTLRTLLSELCAARA